MILVCFALSGGAALVYEIVWLRLLSLTFGHTVLAISAVLAGLGLGGALVGRLADRPLRRVALYGALECGIGAWGLLLPPLLAQALPASLALGQALGLPAGAVGLVQFVLAFLLLLPATVLMGASLPLLARAVTRAGDSAGRRAGALYAANILGAVVGAAAAGYLLLPAVGARVTLHAAAAANLAVGLAALALGWRGEEPAPATGVGAAAAPPSGTPPAPAAGSVLAALALSGAAAMVFEVAWTRVLTLVIGSTTYAFTAILIAMLAGLALGSAAFASLGPAAAGRGALGGILVAVAAGALAMLPTFDRFPGLVAHAFSLSSEPDFVLAVQVVVSALLVLGPALLLGATFPCAVGLLATDAARPGREVARLYAANAGGAVAGAVAAGIGLVPALGAQNAVRAGAALELLAAALVVAPGFHSLAPRWRGAAVAAAAVVLAALVALPGWDRAVMTSGVAVYGPRYGSLIDRVPMAELARGQQLLFYEDGPTATVSVHQGAVRTLRENGRVEASTGEDMPTRLLLGHLPLLVHPHPRRVLLVGLGSGITLGAIVRHPVERVDVVEIEPAMVRAARLFAAENHGALDDPRVSIAIGGARSFLLAHRRRYDVIVSGTSNPWISGVATLFTAEFYALAAARLAPGGIMLQWAPGYSLAPEDLRMVVRTFRTAFPATSVWLAAPGDYLLLGRARAEPFPVARVAERYAASAGIGEDFARSALPSPSALLADFVLGEADAARYAAGAPVNTDDLLPLEFAAARSFYVDALAANRGLLRRFRSAGLAPEPERAEDRYAMAIAYAARDEIPDALGQLDRALARDPRHVPSLLERGRLLRQAGRPGEALASLEAAARLAPADAEVQFEIGLARQAKDGPAAALPAYGRAAVLAPARPDFLRTYATALVQAGQPRDAIAYLLLARAFRPRDPSLMDLVAFVYLQTGNTARAIELLREAIAVAPGEAIYHFRLGQALVLDKQRAGAVAEFRRAAELRPDFVEAHLELANTYLTDDQIGPAVAEYRRVLALDPRNAMALRVLATLRP